MFYVEMQIDGIDYTAKVFDDFVRVECDRLAAPAEYASRKMGCRLTYALAESAAKDAIDYTHRKITTWKRAVATTRIRRRAKQYRAFKAEALSLQANVTIESAIADAAKKGKSVSDVRARIVEQLGECWRNLASRKREVRRLPHMRRYHTEYALGEMALIRMGTAMLAEIDARS